MVFYSVCVVTTVRGYVTGRTSKMHCIAYTPPCPVALAQKEWLTELLKVLGPELSFPFAVKPGGGSGGPFPVEEESNRGVREEQREGRRRREGGREEGGRERERKGGKRERRRKGRGTWG